MSNFLKQGKRKSEDYKRRNAKVHTKEFYKILDKISTIVPELLKEDIEYTEENINEYASKYFGRDIDNMEKLLLLGNLQIKLNETK